MAISFFFRNFAAILGIYISIRRLSAIMQFKDIIGQEEVKQRLRQSVQEGRVPHAQLFTGPEGVGKLPMAIAYAQYLNCPHRTPEDSCGVCPTCLQYKNLQHPDLHFAFPIVKSTNGDVCDDFYPLFREQLQDTPYFDLEDWYKRMGVETKQGMIYEKESGEIVRKLSLKAFGDGFKVMVIWQAEKMNVSCANKLLKLLEEPPEKTVFLLVSEHPEALLSTILSRVQQVRIGKVSEAEMQRQGVPADIARIANGNVVAARKRMASDEDNNRQLEDFKALMRDAYTVGVLQDKQKKFESLQRLRKWSETMADAKVGREKQKAFLQYAQQQVRENYIYNLQLQAELNYQTNAEAEFSTKFARFIHSGNVEQIMNELARAERQIEQNGNAKMIFFDLCLQMIVLIKDKK